MADLKAFPVWQYTHADSDETAVRPVAQLPVRNLAEKLVAGEWGVMFDADPHIGRLERHHLGSFE